MGIRIYALIFVLGVSCGWQMYGMEPGKEGGLSDTVIETAKKAAVSGIGVVSAPSGLKKCVTAPLRFVGWCSKGLFSWCWNRAQEHPGWAAGLSLMTVIILGGSCCVLGNLNNSDELVDDAEKGSAQNKSDIINEGEIAKIVAGISTRIDVVTPSIDQRADNLYGIGLSLMDFNNQSIPRSLKERKKEEELIKEIENMRSLVVEQLTVRLPPPPQHNIMRQIGTVLRFNQMK